MVPGVTTQTYGSEALAGTWYMAADILVSVPQWRKGYLYVVNYDKNNMDEERSDDEDENTGDGDTVEEYSGFDCKEEAYFRSNIRKKMEMQMTKILADN